MSWRIWTTSCLVAALAGVLAGAVYAAATGSFGLPQRTGTGSLPAPGERPGPSPTTSGPTPAVVSPAAVAAPDRSTRARTAARTAAPGAKKPKAGKPAAKKPAAKKPAAKPAPAGKPATPDKPDSGTGRKTPPGKPKNK